MEGFDKDTRAYDFQESRKFRALAERHVTGAFSVESRSVLSQYVLGRATMMFSTWFVSRLSSAFSTAKYSKEGGMWNTVQNADGTFEAVGLGDDVISQDAAI